MTNPRSNSGSVAKAGTEIRSSDSSFSWLQPLCYTAELICAISFRSCWDKTAFSFPEMLYLCHPVLCPLGTSFLALDLKKGKQAGDISKQLHSFDRWERWARVCSSDLLLYKSLACLTRLLAAEFLWVTAFTAWVWCGFLHQALQNWDGLSNICIAWQARV